MAKYEDLSVYNYLDTGIRPNTVNVGWISGGEFRRGQTSRDFQRRLWKFCCCPIIQTRGFHVCDLPGCENRTWESGILNVRLGDEVLELGSAEIRVFGRNGALYAAPDLIYHYVVDHQYQPPEEFIDAVCTAPSPGDGVYFELLMENHLRWRFRGNAARQQAVNRTSQPKHGEGQRANE